MKKKLNNGIFYVVISFVAILAIGSIVAAYSSYSAPKYNAESGATIVVNEAQIIQPEASGDVSVIADESLGAVSGPEFSGPYFTFNGITHWFYSASANIGSTTLCSFLTPAATSTLVFGSIKVNTATGTILYLEIGKSTNSNTRATNTLANLTATTTSLGIYALPSSAFGTVIASSSPASPFDGSQIFAPRSYLVFNGAAGTVNGVYSVKGGAQCKAEFIEN